MAALVAAVVLFAAPSQRETLAAAVTCAVALAPAEGQHGVALLAGMGATRALGVVASGGLRREGI
ncbi:hypothetical protein [Actinophytocola sp.]|uniref:hypothetical protein n=1 Tax=Actinophytocola sp. TaxID=1872138 RepID=UPI00389B0D9F